MAAETAVGADPRQARSSIRHRLADRGVDRGLLLLIPAVVVLFALFIYPFSYGIGLTVQPSTSTQQQADGGILANYVAFFTDPYLFDTVWYTLRLALPVAFLSVVMSLPIAFALRSEFRGKRFMLTVLVLPIAFGAVLISQGLLIFAGNSGWIARFLIGIGVISSPLPLTMNYTGVFLSLIVGGFPFAFLLISSYLSGIDPSLEDAAKTLGASRTKRFTRILLPLLAPGLTTTLILSFVLAFGVFPSAQLVGDALGSTRVMSIVAFEEFGGVSNDYPMASTVAILMGIVELLVVVLLLLGRSRMYKGPTGGKG